MNNFKIYNTAYKIIGEHTPLSDDCGRLCQHACCKGDTNQGMVLYPGEEELFDKSVETFITLKKCKTNEMNLDIEEYLAVCDGTCDRELRPLACRIFPLVPYFDKHNKFYIILDPRADAVCPLTKLSYENDISQSFIESVGQAFSYLLRYKDIEEYILRLSWQLDSLIELRKKFN